MYASLPHLGQIAQKKSPPQPWLEFSPSHHQQPSRLKNKANKVTDHLKFPHSAPSRLQLNCLASNTSGMILGIPNFESSIQINKDNAILHQQCHYNKWRNRSSQRIPCLILAVYGKECVGQAHDKERHGQGRAAKYLEFQKSVFGLRNSRIIYSHLEACMAKLALP